MCGVERRLKPDSKAFTRQLHITDNFTFVEREFRAFLGRAALWL
jgi:hypothetical protein